jgi:2-polyprenyl-3-methyl-5-hydroxy-6-metoxy-1,4-benzoquinol methylase
VSEYRLRAGGEIDWETAYEGDIPDTPVDRDVVRIASELPPGTALDLGCGSGQNSIWLGARGWRVHCVDVARGAIERAESAAARAGVPATFERADVTTWGTRERYDLVISTYALPSRGPGRAHALTVARDAVAPGGTLLISDFDRSLADSGWMAADHLVSLDELTEALPGFVLEEAAVRVTEHRHGTEADDLPVAIVVARHPGSATLRA